MSAEGGLVRTIGRTATGVASQKRIEWLRRELDLRYQQTRSLLDPSLLQVSQVLDQVIVQEQRRLARVGGECLPDDDLLPCGAEADSP
jgi:hypothetical protein